MARKLGAQETFNSKDSEKVRKGRSFDVVVDFVGIEPTFKQAQTYVKAGGVIVLVGLGSVSVPLMTTRIGATEVRVQGSFWGTHEELKEVFELIKEKKINPQVEVGKLKDVNHWLEELHQGKVKSRIALKP